MTGNTTTAHADAAQSEAPQTGERSTEPIRAALSAGDDLDFTIIELLFFAYRDFTSDPDQILAE